jgi:hypothetical protein
MVKLGKRGRSLETKLLLRKWVVIIGFGRNRLRLISDDRVWFSGVKRSRPIARELF